MGLETFEQFERRKEREALAARLPPYVTTFDARPPDALAVGNEWTHGLLDGDFYLSPPPDAERPACSLVFVQSADGNTGAANPTLLGGGATDKHLIYEGLSRVAADAVLAGAETVRGGRIVFSVWHPELVRLRAALGKPRHPLQLVATLRGLDLDDRLLFNTPEIAVVLLTVPSARSSMSAALSLRPWIRPIVMKGPASLAEAFEQIRSLGVDRISCVGGRNLATQLIDAGLVQDIYLTTAARPGGQPNTPMYPKPLNASAVVGKKGTGVESGVVFEHLRLEGPAVATIRAETPA
jgi:5-amino-6-(5-phosphoribosylamino)uracil reductase